MKQDTPLAGLTIIDLSTYVAGPSGTMALAQLGAEVIRIDPVGGATDFRRLPLDRNGNSLYWGGLNREKRSLEINTKTIEGQELVISLLVASGSNGGILLTNAVGQDWLTFARLLSRRKDLIKVHITGRSDGGPAVDYTVNCEVGLPHITGPAGFDRPINHVLPAWDLLTGLHASIGILAADRMRTQTGVGQEISISLADVAVATMSHLGFLADAVINERDRWRDGNFLFGSFGCDFKTQDDRRVMIVALTERQWHNLVGLTGTEEVVHALERAMDIDLNVEEARYRLRELLVALLSPWFAQREFDEVAAALDENHVLWGPYRTVTELLGEPDSIFGTSSIFDMVPHQGAVSYPAPRSVLSFGGWGQGAASPSPILGEGTFPVLNRFLGIDEKNYDNLRRRGIVGGHSL